MSRPIPTRWDDIEEQLATTATAQFPDARISTVKPRQPSPYECFVIRGDLQQKITPITRYARLGIQAWSVSSAGESNLKRCFEMAESFAGWLESEINTPAAFISCEVDSGPMRVRDSDSGVEYAYVTLLAEVHAK